MNSGRPDWASDLARFLGADVLQEMRRLSGGASRETWSFTALHAGGRETPQIIQIVRRDSEHRLDRELAIIDAASEAGVPVAKVVAHCLDDSVVGAPFAVSQHVDGETLGRRIVKEDEYRTARELLTGQLGEALARIHAIEDASVSSDLPAIEDIMSVVRREIDDIGRPSPTAELTVRWLQEHRPVEERPIAVVHGDFRLGNLIVDRSGLRAVLDWELTHLGDPAEDLGWVCVRAWRYGGAGRVAGAGSLDALLDSYLCHGGVSTTKETVLWWQVVGTLRWMIGGAMQANLHLRGDRRSHELAVIGRRAAESEYELLRLMEIGLVA